MKKLALLGLLALLCGCAKEAEKETSDGDIVAFDLSRTRELSQAKFMVEAARQAADLPKEIESASCSEDKRTGIHTCEYALKENPGEKQKATVVQCDVAFYFDKCPDNLGI